MGKKYFPLKICSLKNACCVKKGIKFSILVRYELTANPIWWPDLVQMKDRQKYVTCQSKTEERKTFNIKVRLFFRNISLFL